ncbi:MULTISPECIES: ABC transporter ATP-binding protein [Thalassospira]|jgi:lipoprotein-releasing system ATP-binding protein|uniref:ABC transporter n=3 Tax=Thalassospira TaxID=168934 RepID=A0ABR5Y4I8_9PROT|nr:MULTISPECIES: ABC transporter ATP-binding protein [Thalassospira]MBR9780976.1 ABC transporter ATP-binding protein [Rhodospirillales bacterium]KEO53637.1 ABC transporter ATP-binding protein [Thalassospira permensis NBRC 106175]KZD05021.1 ABC transporter [Thalassospira xiamenensis]KZD11713.1 ABC transporter [Thalassospira xiamenensis]MAB31610.1 ABC transporter ATP-binding protein [Thalassospira sp.]|tara:strand:- start:218 stop:952 length:735 start_codon:yes stop_codon:yes gene_type:complete
MSDMIKTTAKERAQKVVLRLEKIDRVFNQGPDQLEILKSVDLEIHQGEIVALVGPSGAGKSTLLQIAGLLEKPDGGMVSIGGKRSTDLSDLARTEMRRKHIGFVYQYHHLLPEFSAIENVVIPQMINGLKRADATERGLELLRCLGLEKRAEHRPARLSGGEQQRVAIARALANVPDVLFADEPTGNLDPHTAETVFGMLMTLVRETGLASLIATHNPELARQMDRVVTLRDGHLVELDPDTLS